MENEEIILIKRVHSRNARTCHSSHLTRQRFFIPCNEGLIDSNGQFLGRSSFQHKTPNSFQENGTFSRKVFRLLTFSACAVFLNSCLNSKYNFPAKISCASFMSFIILFQFWDSNLNCSTIDFFSKDGKKFFKY